MALLNRAICYVTKTFYICLLRMMLLISSGHGFNLDLRTATIHRGQPGSMFGYSVAQHQDGDQQWILVGAPKSETDQPGVNRPGAVFRCRFDVDDCHQVPLDIEGNEAPWTGSEYAQIEEKSNQMLGASVYSSGQNGVMLACAPNYVYFTQSRNRREPVGTCYVSRPDRMTFKKVSPCKKILRESDRQQAMFGKFPENLTPYGYKSQGYCQSGFSALFTSDALRLVAGAPGSYFWQGQVFSQNLQDDIDTLQTGEQSDKLFYDDTYLGYSMTTARLDDDFIEDYAVGSPKLNFTGKVLLLNDQLRTLGELDGLQMGESFGYSIATGDFNGDGLADLAVGAPFYSSYDSIDSFETGRVHVFLQLSQGVWLGAPRTLITGSSKSGSRFGLAVSGLGDMNRDSYDDLAVGAPYDGENGRGVVYIYHGSSEGLRNEAAQKINAQDFSSELQAFGYSLSGGKDQDDNTYTDLLIGAYESAMAVTLKSRPIITVNTNMRLDPRDVILEEQMCDLPDRQLVSCFTVKTCLDYDGHRTPAEIVLELEWRVDSLKDLTPRAFVMEEPYNQVTRIRRLSLVRRQETCQSFIVYVKQDIRDKLTPVVVKLNYSLMETTAPLPGEPTAMLDEGCESSDSVRANIQKNCGPDSICIPDLSVQATAVTDKYILGEEASVNVRIRIRNYGEGSYESLLHISLPPGASYINVAQKDTEYSIQCTAQNVTQSQSGSVVCDLGNPLPEQTQILLTLRSRVLLTNFSVDFLSYTFTVNSSNQEINSTVKDNIARVHIPVSPEAKIRLAGVSNPEQVLHNGSAVTDIRSEDDIGPELIHLYEVRNTGSSTIESVEVVIQWPAMFGNAYADLLYLPVMPIVIRGKGQCYVEGVNYKNLTVRERDAHVDMELYYSSLKRILEEHSRDRTRRAVVQEQISQSDQYIKTLRCGVDYQLCARIECTIGPLESKDNALIQITSRVWINTIIELQNRYRGLVLTSEAAAIVTSLPHHTYLHDQPHHTFQIETYVAALNVNSRDTPLPWWLVAVAVVVGFILLLLLTLLLRKCGFFKRRKPDVMPVHSGKVDKNNGTISPKRSSPVRTYNYDNIPGSDF